MPVPSYELTRLDSNNFEHLVNALAMRVLGAGLTGFGPGADGGRDGYFEGKADYPSKVDQWNGRWYIQSKFHPPHLSTDSQKWLLTQIQTEITAFKSPQSRRTIPDIWIVASNIEPSGVAETGCYDAARLLVQKSIPELADRFHIWGGRKILDLLALFPDISAYYGEFLTPGNVLKRLHDELADTRAGISEIFRHLTVTQMMEQQYTKLEQAGSTVDNRPGIQKLFTDIPFNCNDYRAYTATTFAKTLAQIHRPLVSPSNDENWIHWRNAPQRARVWFVKGGPGQGKSTLTQYIAQIQRSALILQSTDFPILPAQAAVVEEIKLVSRRQGLWPESPRVPVTVELKEYAFWLGQRGESQSRRMISYLAERLEKELGLSVLPGTLKRAFSTARWLFVFDGLDEVPTDVKDSVANEIIHFVDDLLVGCNSDAVTVCTSRPQGYSGQFASLGASNIELTSLSAEQALRCATPLLKIDRSATDSAAFIETLRAALKSPPIAEIMKTPLQAHIMAVIVRDGGRPPERRWKLYNTFYEIIKKREANRNLPEKNLASLLRTGDKLLRAIHNRLGFDLHARAETSRGATTSLDRDTLKRVVTETVSRLQDKSIRGTVATVMKATTERLVLVNTPESGEHVRFDIRQLQEFFAAEYSYRDGDFDSFHDRIQMIAADAHWREVMHFLISALIENGRNNELAIATSVLEEVDSGSSGAERTFNRRLARGARITVRLLTEGVLEEDKQVRARFLNAIIPISAQSYPVELFGRQLQQHSLAWVQDALFVAIREQALQETIGAAVSLGHLLPDRDKRSVEITQFITSAGSDYIAYFLAAIARDSHYGPRKHFKWVVGIACDFLRHENWYNFPEAAVNAAVLIAGSRPETLRQKLGLSKESTAPAILSSCLLSTGGGRIAGIRPKTYFIHGSLELHLEPPHPNLDYMAWNEELWSELSEIPGIFRAIFALFDMLKTKSRDSLQNFLTNIGDSCHNISLLPQPVRNFLRDHLVSIPPKDVHSVELLIETAHAGWNKFTFGLNFSEDVDLAGIARENPELFIPVIQAEEYAVKKLEFFEDEKNFSLIERGVLAHAHGDLLSTWAFISEHDQLRESFSGMLLSLAEERVVRQRFRRNITPFVVNLLTESALLPHIVSAMIDAIEAETHPRYFPHENSRVNLYEWTPGFIEEPAGLKSIFYGNNHSQQVRAAAYILYHLHPKTTEIDNPSLLLELYDRDSSQWMLPGIANCLFASIQSRENGSLDVFGTLLDRSSGDYFGRAALDSVFKAWRESSDSPVTNSALNRVT